MFERTQDKLKGLNQEHLLKALHGLDDVDREKLGREIFNIDEVIFKKQQELTLQNSEIKSASFEPYTDYLIPEIPTFKETGYSALSQGLMGCLIVSGGQGSRLGMGNRPKGKFPVTVVKKKSLFQLFAEKTVAASKFAGTNLPLAIMTSPMNTLETCTFFNQNHYFGLEPNQIDFFTQDMLPFLDENANLFLEERVKLASGPDGNGLALRNFYKSGLWNKWKELGVQFVNFILIDNPLADPFDLRMLGAAVSLKTDVIIKSIKRVDASEKVGVIVKEKGKIKIIEYTELSSTDRFALDPNGNLKHLCANISLFCFSMDFIERVAKIPLKELPIHAVKKMVKNLNYNQATAWKFERFIFDILPYSNSTATLVVPRETTFAPLKNSSGPDSIDTVQAALQLLDIQIYRGISGSKPPLRVFELAQDFHYPTAELKRKWYGKALPENSYIEP